MKYIVTIYYKHNGSDDDQDNVHFTADYLVMMAVRNNILYHLEWSNFA